MGKRADGALRGPLGSALIFASLTAWACQDVAVGGEVVAADFDRTELFASIVNNAVGPTFADFVSRADDLQAATTAYADALDTGDAAAPELRQAARDAWAAAMGTWQRAEVMQLGPVGTSLTAVGGEDLRDEVYSWPTINSCRVDQETVEVGYDNADFFEAELVNVHGLDTIEYLIFNESLENTCAGQDAINTGPWAALEPAEIEVRRARYAAAVAGHVADTARAMKDAWDPGSGDFADWLVHPAENGSPYESEAVVLDELMRVMFYADGSLKDDKVAHPGGILGCASEMCPEALESRWAAHSKEHVLANLEGLRLVFLGGTDPGAGTGFDDFLEAADQAELADQMIAHIDAAIATVQGVEGSFAEALASDPSALDEPHAAIKAVTDALKGPFAMALALRVPNEAAGDND